MRLAPPARPGVRLPVRTEPPPGATSREHRSGLPCERLGRRDALLLGSEICVWSRGWCHGKKREAPLRERVRIPGSSPWDRGSPRLVPARTCLYLRSPGALQGCRGSCPAPGPAVRHPSLQNPSHRLCPVSCVAPFSRDGFRSPEEVLGTAPQACRAGPAVWHGWVPLQGRAAGSHRVPHGAPGRPQVQSRDSDHWHHGYSVPQPRGKSCPFLKPLTGPVEWRQVFWYKGGKMCSVCWKQS